LFPSSNRSCQKHQEHPIHFGARRSFAVSAEDDKLLAEKCVLSDQFGLATGLVGQHPRHERGGVRFGPDNEAVVERLKTQACHACDERENPLHGRRSPL
jgi:hypothetical protein